MSLRSRVAWVACALAAFAAGVDASAADPAPAKETGLVLDRLTPSELRQWRSLERLANASGPNGTPLYPTLRGLWQWAAHGDHALYIELSSPDCAARGMAGKFVVAGFEAQGARHVGVIRLCLATIDGCPTCGGGTRASGFVRFAGLGKEERHLEVLGHELAHAAYDFASPERARMVHTRVETVNAEIVTHRAEHGNEPFGPALDQRLEERNVLLEELEAYADSIEWLVWRELANRRSGPK